MEVLKAKTVEVFQGSSTFSSVLLNDLLQASKSKLLLLKAELAEDKENVCRHQARWSSLFRLRQEIASKRIRNLDKLSISIQRR